MLLSESNDGVVSFFLSDGLLTGGQLSLNPGLDFTHLLLSQFVPFGLHEVSSFLLDHMVLKIFVVLDLWRSPTVY